MLKRRDYRALRDKLSLIAPFVIDNHKSEKTESMMRLSTGYSDINVNIVVDMRQQSERYGKIEILQDIFKAF